MSRGVTNVIRNCYSSRFLITRHSSSLSWKEAIDLKNPSTNALIYTPRAICQAESHDLPLSDMAIAVKDNICTSSMPTTCSSAMLREFMPPFDATVVDALKQAGAYIVGKTNCDEFGMGSLNTNSVHGPVVNPYQTSPPFVHWENRERRSAGGSSGGSAAAVAAGMCDAALSTDTGGSTRLPASYCGVVGLKPSYGLISRWGVVSFADSLDCVGIMAKNVHAVKRVFDTISFYDTRDPTAATQETRRSVVFACKEHVHPWSTNGYPQGRLNGLRIGVPQEYFPAELELGVLRPFRHLLKRLKSLGASLISVSLPSTSYALSAYYVISSAEASSNMARYDGVQYGLHVNPPPDVDRTKSSAVYAWIRSRGFGDEVQKRMLLGTYALTADAFDNYFLQAQRVRNQVRTDFDCVFRFPNVLSSYPTANSNGVDILFHPSAIRTAPLLETSSPGLQTYVQDVLTVPASLAGLPALNVPIGLADDGWPVGASVIGQWGCDEMVLKVGETIEEQIVSC